MASLDFTRMVRVLDRCAELPTQPGIPGIIAMAYNDKLKQVSEAFRAAHVAVDKQEMAWGKENKEAVEALRKFDATFSTARAAVLAYVPAPKVPATLKALPTETDKKIAVETLLDLVDDNAEQPWGKMLLEGDFGKGAPGVLKEIEESIAANKVFSAARAERAKLYGPAWEGYLSFKRIVRAALGPASKEYRRIHIRGTGTIEDDPAEPGQPTPPVVPVPPVA